MKTMLGVRITSPIKEILIASAPIIFTIIFQFILFKAKEYIGLYILSCYLVSGCLWISKHDWENIKDAYKELLKSFCNII